MNVAGPSTSLSTHAHDVKHGVRAREDRQAHEQLEGQG